MLSMSVCFAFSSITVSVNGGQGRSRKTAPPPTPQRCSLSLTTYFVKRCQGCSLKKNNGDLVHQRSRWAEPPPAPRPQRRRRCDCAMRCVVNVQVKLWRLSGLDFVEITRKQKTTTKLRKPSQLFRNQAKTKNNVEIGKNLNLVRYLLWRNSSKRVRKHKGPFTKLHWIYKTPNLIESVQYVQQSLDQFTTHTWAQVNPYDSD